MVDPSYSFGYFGVLKKTAVSYDCEVLFASLSGVLISDCHGNAPSSLRVFAARARSLVFPSTASTTWLM